MRSLIVVCVLISVTSSGSPTPPLAAAPIHGSLASPRLGHPETQASGVGEHRHELRVKVNGKDNPELVPDEYAYRHLIAATAVSDAQSSQRRALSRTFINRIGLTDADRSAYEATLRTLSVRDELTRIAGERQALSKSSLQGSPQVAALIALQTAERNLLGLRLAGQRPEFLADPKF